MTGAHAFQAIAFHIGPIPIYWYKLMYAAGAFIAFFGIRHFGMTHQCAQLMDRYKSSVLFLAVFAGVIFGGRLGYEFLYDTTPFTWASFLPNQGGMSFHGAIFLASIFGAIACRYMDIPGLVAADAVFTFAPIGIALGRLGNFINGELWGRVSDVPWAMVFPLAGPNPRHPSQLYEMTLEGLVPFAILMFLYRRPMHPGKRTLIFLYCYCLARIVCEMFRQPDPQIGFLYLGLTEGMVLTLGMFCIAVALHLYTIGTIPPVKPAKSS